jgi:hypothetical protein
VGQSPRQWALLRGSDDGFSQGHWETTPAEIEGENNPKKAETEMNGMGSSNKGKPTMDDVAELANVCKSTVSMALSNDSRITEGTRKRVLEVVKSLNYQVNQTARALALRKNRKKNSDLPMLEAV